MRYLSLFGTTILAATAALSACSVSHVYTKNETDVSHVYTETEGNTKISYTAKCVHGDKPYLEETITANDPTSGTSRVCVVTNSRFMTSLSGDCSKATSPNKIHKYNPDQYNLWKECVDSSL